MSRKAYHDNRAERDGGTDAEPLYRCAGCLRRGFTMRGMNSHVCRPPISESSTPNKEAPRMATKSTTRNPVDLKPHPLFAKTHHPMMPKDTPEWAALVASVREHGVLETIKVTDDGLIVDGRHRAAAAVEAGLHTVRVEVVDGALAPLIIAETLVHRRHYNKAARAYLLAPFAEEAAAAGKKAGIANLRQNSPGVEKIDAREEGAPSTLESFADRMGISRDYLIKARDIHTRLDRIPAKVRVTDPETKEDLPVREYVDRLLLGRGAGFQPVLAMLGYLAAGNKAQGERLKNARAEYGRLAAEKFAKLTDNLRGWDKVDAVEREILYTEMPKQVAQWPAEVAQRLYTELAKRRDEWTGKN